MPSTINADNGVVSGSSGVKTTADTSGVLALQSNGSTGLTLDTSLNVGIGVTTPASRLHLRGSSSTYTGGLVAQDSTSNYFTFYGYGNDGVIGTVGNIRFASYDGSSERGRFDSSGEFLLGTTSAGASQRLAIVGAETLCMMKNTSATSSTQRTTILFRDNGDNSVGTLKTSTAGINLTGVTGITFPATQSASADANTLDDYEEGTWTPSYSGGLSGVTYGTVRNGFYTKIGNQVTVWFGIMTDGLTVTSSSLNISGLPFTSKSSLGAFNTVNLCSAVRWVSNPPVVGEILTNTATIGLYSNFNLTGAGTDPTLVTTGNMATGSGNRNVIYGTATYTV